MGWGWWKSAVVATGFALMSACNGGGAQETTPVAARVDQDQIATWRSKWTDSAQEFWKIVSRWKTEIYVGDDSTDVVVTAAAAPAVVNALERWESLVTVGAVPGDIEAKAATLRTALQSYRRTWAEIAACGPVAFCQEKLSERARAELPDVRTAEFDLRPR